MHLLREKERSFRRNSEICNVTILKREVSGGEGIEDSKRAPKELKKRPNTKAWALAYIGHCSLGASRKNKGIREPEKKERLG